MTLTALREIIINNKRKFLIFGGVLVVGVLALSFVYREVYLTSTKSGGVPSFDLSATTGVLGGTLDSSKLPAVSFPTHAAIYEGTSLKVIMSEQEARALAKKFGLGIIPSVATTPDGAVYTFVEGKKTLMVSADPREITYSWSNAGGSGSLWGETQASQKAKEFLSSVGLTTSDLSVFGVQYLEDLQGRFSVAGKDEAKFVEVSFARLVGNIPLIGESPTEAAARVIFDPSGKVAFLTFDYPDTTFSKVADVPLLSLDVVLPQIFKEGKVVLVRPEVGVSKWALPVSPVLTEFVPDEIELAFVQPLNSKFLYPVYLLSGAGKMQGEDVFASLYLLAISQD